MNKETVEKRKQALQDGLQSLQSKVIEITRAMEMQKGAISECDHWLKELETPITETTKESTMTVED